MSDTVDTSSPAIIRALRNCAEFAARLRRRGNGFLDGVSDNDIIAIATESDALADALERSDTIPPQGQYIDAETAAREYYSEAVARAKWPLR